MKLDYNIFLELAVIPLDIILCSFLIVRYKEPTPIARAFRRFAFFVMIADIVDVLTAVVTSAHALVPNPVHYLFNITDSVLAGFAAFSYIYYVYAYAEMDAEEFQLRNRINHILLFTDLFLLLTNPLTGWVFTYDQAGNYIHRELFILVAYGFPLIFFVIGCIYLLRHREKYKRSQVLALVTAMIIMFVLYLVQMLFFDNLLITFFMASLGVLLILLSLETPDYIALLKTMEELNASEKRAKEAADAAIAAGKAKSRFLAQMSHEIRTPINAVLGMNEMILRESEDDGIIEYAESIKTAGKNLLTIINGILDFSKIEDGRMEIIPVNYHLGELLQQLEDAVKGRAEEKALDFIIEADPKLPSVLFGDDVRLIQVITNLLTNAVKYTEKGKVVLQVQEKQREYDTILLDIRVSDTGIGIKETDMDRLFEAFERLEEERNRTIEGTGLGMSITTKLLAMMDSHLQVKSVYGEGSVFSFVIRQRIVDQKPLGDYKKHIEDMGNKQADEEILYAPEAEILVVDDNEMNRRVVKNLMKRNGIVPALASSGEEAIEKMEKNEYHIVFLDHMMPKPDGIETLAILRERKLYTERTKMIALTANAIVGARETYLEAGFDDYLSKPIEVTELEGMMKKYLPKELVVQRKAREAEISEAMSKEHDETLEPVPEENHEVLEFMPEEDREILEFAPEEDDGILEFVPETGEEKLSEQDKVEKKESEPETIFKNLRAEGISVETGLRYCGGDIDFYMEILGDYVHGFKEKTKELETYYQSQDWQEYKVSVHALKSTSKTIGADDFAEQALRMEEAAKREDGSYITEHYDSFIDEYRSLTEKIEGALRG